MLVWKQLSLLKRKAKNEEFQKVHTKASLLESIFKALLTKRLYQNVL